MRLSPRLQIALAAVLFSTGGVAIKATELTAWQVASFRSLVAALFLAAAMPAARRSLSWRAALVGVAYAGTLVCFVLATRLTTGANAIFLQSTAPFFLVILAPLLLRERPDRRDALPLVAVVVGLLLVLVGTEPATATAPDPVLGNSIAVVSGLSYALLLIGFRWLSREDPSGQAAVGSVVLGNVIAAVATVPLALPVVGMGGDDLGIMVYLGVVQIGFAYMLVTRGMRSVPALDASLLLLLETVLNPVWIWLALAERPSALALVGGGIIAAGTVLRAARRERVVTPVT